MNKSLFACLFAPLALFSNFDLIEDMNNFYSKKTFYYALRGFTIAAPMTVSGTDEKIDAFWQTKIRTKNTDHFAHVFKQFGENKTFIIMISAGTTAGYLMRSNALGRFIFDFSINTMRGTFIGLPAVVAMQNVLGASRPHEGRGPSYRPFHNDHGVSGHSYMGAIPFLTLAKMSDDLLVKVICTGAASLTGLSRINDRAHYMSQVIMGWAFAYAAVEAVHKTNSSIEISADRISYVNEF